MKIEKQKLLKNHKESDEAIFFFSYRLCMPIKTQRVVFHWQF